MVTDDRAKAEWDKASSGLRPGPAEKGFQFSGWGPAEALYRDALRSGGHSSHQGGSEAPAVMTRRGRAISALRAAPPNARLRSLPSLRPRLRVRVPGSEIALRPRHHCVEEHPATRSQDDSANPGRSGTSVVTRPVPGQRLPMRRPRGGREAAKGTHFAPTTPGLRPDRVLYVGVGAERPCSVSKVGTRCPPRGHLSRYRAPVARAGEL